MQISTTKTNDGYAEGWTFMALLINQKPSTAVKALTHFALNPPADAFHVGAMQAAQVAFGH